LEAEHSEATSKSIASEFNAGVGHLLKEPSAPNALQFGYGCLISPAVCGSNANIGPDREANDSTKCGRPVLGETSTAKTFLSLGNDLKSGTELRFNPTDPE
jgi:hypothetical protein